MPGRISRTPTAAACLLGALLCTASACAPERLEAPGGEGASQRLLPPGDSELLFTADFAELATGPLVAGTSARLVYDEDRLTQCRSWKYGQPAWGITALYRIDGGEIRNVPIAMPNQTLEPWIDLDQPGELELWFANNDAYGCIAWDSNYGENYRFEVLPDRVVPAWMGAASSVVSRRTCSGGSLCDADLRPLDQGFVYDTWARQRALVAETTFQAWAPGVTDTQRERVWELLDARIHWSTAPDVPETGWDWVRVHDFVGNDVRYAYSLRELDPLGGSTITDPADCPDLPLRLTDDGMYVEADLWLWFSVNDAPLQPETGAWRGTFRDYAGLYAPCL